MNYILVAIEDIYTGFNSPRAIKNREAARRDFQILCQNDPKAEDYRLWYVGDFNTETGEITNCKLDLIDKGVRNDS